MSLLTTSSQTIGPYLHIGTDWLNTSALADVSVNGERIMIQGKVFDGNGRPVNDALLEIWQANAQGRYAHPADKRDLPLEKGFRGFGRIPTDDQGGFRFTTIKPGRVPGPDGQLQAPHLMVTIFARGLLKQLVTRIYFPDDHADDPVLQMVPPERHRTLVARPMQDNTGILEWNVVLQGEVDGWAETVFFDI